VITAFCPGEESQAAGATMETATIAIENSGNVALFSVNAIVGMVVGVICVIGASVFIGYKATQNHKHVVTIDDSYRAM
jgi:hypothetical protein